jgi:hypothetical protein
MKNIILANAFSIQMLTEISNGWIPVKFQEISIDDVKELLADGFTSAIGHQDTAAVVSDLLEMDVPANRISVELKNLNDIIIIAQVMGGRLPEGATTIPEGMSIKFIKAQIMNLSDWAPL